MARLSLLVAILLVSIPVQSLELAKQNYSWKFKTSHTRIIEDEHQCLYKISPENVSKRGRLGSVALMKSYHYQTTSFATKTTHADLCEEATKGLLKKVRLEARDDTSDTSISDGALVVNIRRENARKFLATTGSLTMVPSERESRVIHINSLPDTHPIQFWGEKSWVASSDTEYFMGTLVCKVSILITKDGKINNKKGQIDTDQCPASLFWPHDHGETDNSSRQPYDFGYLTRALAPVPQRMKGVAEDVSGILTIEVKDGHNLRQKYALGYTKPYISNAKTVTITEFSPMNSTVSHNGLTHLNPIADPSDFQGMALMEKLRAIEEKYPFKNKYESDETHANRVTSFVEELKTKPGFSFSFVQDGLRYDVERQVFQIPCPVFSSTLNSERKSKRGNNAYGAEWEWVERFDERLQLEIPCSFENQLEFQIPVELASEIGDALVVSFEIRVPHQWGFNGNQKYNDLAPSFWSKTTYNQAEFGRKFVSNSKTYYYEAELIGALLINEESGLVLGRYMEQPPVSLEAPPEASWVPFE